MSTANSVLMGFLSAGVGGIGSEVVMVKCFSEVGFLRCFMI